MDLVVKLALWAHFLAMAVGGAATFGGPVVAGRMAGAVPEARAALGAVIATLAGLGRKALGTLIVSGAVLVWARYRPGELPETFRVKMILVVIFTGLVIYSVANRRRAMAGDVAAATRAPLLGKIGMGLFGLIVLLAVLTFL